MPVAQADLDDAVDRIVVLERKQAVKEATDAAIDRRLTSIETILGRINIAIIMFVLMSGLGVVIAYSGKLPNVIP